MQDVLIERCTLRVVRRDGWSWGADPRGLLRRLLEAVPGLVAARLADLLPDMPGDGEIAQPIEIRIPIRLDEVRTYSRLDAQIDGGRSARWLAQLDDAVQQAVRNVTIVDSRPGAPTATPHPPEPAAWERTADILREALADWTRAGMLPLLLAAASDETAGRWLEAIGGGRLFGERSTDSEHRAGESASPGEAEAPAPIDMRRGARAGLAAIARRLASGEIDGGRGAPAGGPAEAATESRRTAAQLTDPPRPSASANHPPPPADATHPATPAAPRPVDVSAIASPRDVLVDAEVQVPSALPWLVLVPLHRLGLLRVLRVALEAAAVERQAAFFGAALAYKLTAPAAREWRKTTDAERLAMAMAAQRSAVAKPDLHRFAHRLAPHCALLDVQMARAVASGKAAGSPWLLHASSRDSTPSFTVFDPEGLFPAWWSIDAERAAAALRTDAGTPVVVADAVGDPRLFERLTADGIRFLTTTRPGRGERWVRIHAGGTQPWWSNAAGEVAPGTRRQMARADTLAASGAAIVDEFGARRLAMPLDPAGALERTLSLAAAVALGVMAWELWHAQAPTDPLLALSRLGDLDARIRFTTRAVRVVLPLGRRHRDLYEAGLLADVREVPWLGGRTLEFSGG